MGDSDAIVCSFDVDNDERIPDDVVAEQYLLYSRIHRMITVQGRLLTMGISLIAPILVIHFGYHLRVIDILASVFPVFESVGVEGVVGIMERVLLNESIMLVLVSVSCWVISDKLLYPVRAYYFYKHSIPPEQFGLVFHSVEKHG